MQELGLNIKHLASIVNQRNKRGYNGESTFVAYMHNPCLVL